MTRGFPLPMAMAVLLLVAGCGAGTASAPAGHVDARHGRFALSVLWTRSIAPNADSAPAYLSHVRLAGGARRAMIYVLAGNNTSNCNPGNPVRRATLYAFDAVSGAARWSRSTTGPSRCTTASPAAAGSWVYAPGLDGMVHRYAAATGREYRKQGWPHRITLMPEVEKVSADLRITGHYLYVTTSGFIGDQGHYQGHLVTIDLRNGHATVFNSLCSNVRQLLGPASGRSNSCGFQESGLFGRGQAVTDPANHDVYIVSGNGPWNGRTNWGDSIIKLNSAGSRLLDTFTPTNQAQLEANDLDLGSTGPALLPAIRQGGRSYRLLVQGGKGPACTTCSGTALRLLNRDNLSGQGGPGHLGGDLQDVQAPGGCEVLTAPAIWRAPGGALWVLYANDCGTVGYRLSSPAAGTFRLERVWSLSQGGTTPVVRDGRLYVARTGTLAVYNPATGKVEAQTSIGGIHWQFPLVAGGRLYLTDQSGHVSAYALK